MIKISPHKKHEDDHPAVDASVSAHEMVQAVTSLVYHVKEIYLSETGALRDSLYLFMIEKIPCV